MAKPYTFSIIKANRFVLMAILPVGLVLGLPFYFFHANQFAVFNLDLVISPYGNVLTMLAIFLAGIILHELLHALGWVFFTKNKWKSIKFGFKWEFFTPYCHCKEPLQKCHFMLGAALPCLVLGLVPTIISYLNASPAWWFFGFFFTVSAGGDIIAIAMLRKIPANSWVQDHPDELGFYVLEEEECR